MKIRNFFATLSVACALALSGCGNSEADQKAAIEQLKKDMAGMEAWMAEKQKESAANPMAGIAMFKELVGKMKTMNNDKLPEDLRAAFADFIGQMGKVEALVAELGSDPAEMMKKAMANPQAMQDFSKKMEAIDADTKPIVAKLEEIGKKYGIEKIGKLKAK